MERRYHLYHKGECIASTLTEEMFQVLMNECYNKHMDVSYEIVDIQNDIEESSY